MPGLLDDVPQPQFFARQAVIPNTPQSGSVNNAQPSGLNVAGQAVKAVGQTVLPSEFQKAFAERNVFKSTSHFIAGLAQGAWQGLTFIPKAAYDFTKNNLQMIASGGKTSDMSKELDQGYKESGLAGITQVGLGKILPFGTALLGGVSAPEGATALQFFESLLTGGLANQGKTGKITEEAATTTALPKELPVAGEKPIINAEATVVEKPPTNVTETPAAPGTEAVTNELDNAVKQQILKDNTPPEPVSMTNIGRSVGTRLDELGPAGRELKARIQNYLEQPALKAGGFTADLTQKIQGFTQEELSSLKDVLQGKGKALNSAVEDAANLARAQTDIIAGTAQRLIPGWSPIKNYFTQSLAKVSDLQNTQIRSEIINNMVNVDKTVGSVAEANSLLDSWQTYLEKGDLTQPLIDYVKKTKQLDITDEAGFKTNLQTKLNAFTKPSFKFGPFESRTLNLPFYDPNPARVLPRYYENSFEFLHKLEQWGPSGQKLYDLVNLIGEHGGRNTDAQFAANVTDFLVKGDTSDLAIRNLRDTLLKYNAATKMPLSFISNSVQGFLGTSIAGDLKTAIKMLTKFKDPENVDFSIRAGGIGTSRLERALSGTFGVDVSEGLTSKILKPFKVTEVANYYQSIMGGRLFMEDLVDRLKSNPTDAYSFRKFGNLGFDNAEIAQIAKDGLTEDQAKLGALRFWKQSQAIPDFLNTPEFFNGSWGKIFNQFKGVAYNQTRLIWENVGKEVAHGNLYPLVVLMTVFPAIGEVLGDVKSLFRAQNPFDAKKGHSFAANPTLGNYFSDMGEAFGIGMALDLFNAAKDKSGLGTYWLGPSFQTAGAAFNDIYKLSKGKPDIFKLLLDQVPFIGKPLDNVLLPSSASASEVPHNMLSIKMQDKSGNVLSKQDAQNFADNPIPGVTIPQKGIVGGVNITNYATDPNHEKKVAYIYNNIEAQTPQELTGYIKQKAPKSPITGEMVYQAAKTYKIDPKLITAIIQNDSSFGTKGKGSHGFNPGNVGNNDRGQTIKYTNWQEGVNAVARFLSKSKV